MAENLFFYEEIKTTSPSMSIMNSKVKSNILEKLQNDLKNQKSNETINQNSGVRSSKSSEIKSTSEKEKNKYYDYLLFLKKKLKDDLSEELSINSIQTSHENASVIVINYDNLLAIVNLIYIILDHINLNSKKGKTHFSNFKKRNYSFLSKKLVVNHIDVEKYLESFTFIKTIQFSFSEDLSDRKISEYCVLLFFEFIEILFPCALEAQFDLNISAINNEFRASNDQSMITEEEVQSIGKNYHKQMRINYFITKKIKNLPKFIFFGIKIYDSYHIEYRNFFNQKNINILLTKEELSKFTYSPNQSKKSETLPIKNSNSKIENRSDIDDYSKQLKNEMILLNNFLDIEYPIKFQFEFNSLDPFLFRNVLRILLKSELMCELSLKLFPEADEYNLNKILLNSNYYTPNENENENNNNLSGVEQGYDDDYCYNMVKIANLSQVVPKFIINDKIPKKLFSLFNQNITKLSILIENKIKNLRILCLSLYCIEELEKYNDYQSTMAFFLINILKILEINSSAINLNELLIEINDYNYKYLYEAFKKDFHSYRNGFDLSKLKLVSIKLSMNNINQIVPIEKLPYSTLISITFQRLSLEDFKEFISLIESKKNAIPLLTQLCLEFDYINNFPFELLHTLLSRGIPAKCSKLKISIPFIIEETEMINLIKWYSENQTNINPSLQTQISCCIDCVHIGQRTIRTIFGEQLNRQLINSSILFSNLNFDSLHSFDCNIKFIDHKYKNRSYLPVLYCLYVKNKRKPISTRILNRICVMMQSAKRLLKVDFI